ncbi:MAG: VCBS repeat-containing protein [Planctomycetota bacterium]
MSISLHWTLLAAPLLVPTVGAQVSARLIPNPDGLSAGLDAFRDVNGDGVRDFVSGAADAAIGALTRAGRVRLVSGADGVPLGNIAGTRAYGRLGATTRVIGDINGDGVPEIAVSEDRGGAGNAPARVYIHSGANLVRLRTHDFATYSISSIARLSDVDGDGVADYAVGARTFSVTDHSFVKVFSGATGAELRTFLPFMAPSGFGYSVIELGDLNADGVPDLAIGDTTAFVAGSARGRVQVVSIASGATLLSIDGPAPEYAEFGAGLGAPGDINGDGAPDLIVASALRVRAYSGASGALLWGTPLLSDRWDAEVELVCPGDLDFDGVSEVLAYGRRFSDQPGNQIELSVRLLDGATGSSFLDVQSLADFGLYDQAWVAAGDLDGDGRPELAANARVAGAFRLCILSFPWTGVACESLPNSTGATGTLEVVGPFAVGSTSASLAAGSLPPGVTTMFLVAPAIGAPIQPPGSEGRLCLSGGIGRFFGPGQVQTSSAGGTVQLTLDADALPQPTATVAAVAGETWSFQAWHRDTGATGATSNLTNAAFAIVRP